MDPLEPYLRRVRTLTLEERIFRRIGRVLVAVSGGPDSLAALVVVGRLSQEMGFEVTAGHFDHKLRPESADERAVVKAKCEALGTSCVTGEGDVGAMAADLRIGIEEAARKMRYQFLAFAGAKVGADAIVTGHTRDDQVETVLQHIIRGSGVRGLRGMQAKSAVPGAEAQTLLRPLLVLGRADTEDICRIAGLEPLRDSSNADLRHSRNRVRHEALPTLATMNPRIASALLGLSKSAAESFRLIERMAMETQPLERRSDGAIFALEAIKRLPSEGRALVLEREAAFLKLGFEVNRTRLENLQSVVAGGSGRVGFGEVEAEVSMGSVRIGPASVEVEPPQERPLHVPGVTRAGDWRIEVSTTGGPGATPIPSHTGVLVVRGPRTGDRIELAHKTVRIARFFEERRIPTWDRRRVVVIAAGSRVFALPGVEHDAGPGEAAVYVKATPVAPR
jgi:tRNA(Ile)-lysidine synthase